MSCCNVCWSVSSSWSNCVSCVVCVEWRNWKQIMCMHVWGNRKESQKRRHPPKRILPKSTNPAEKGNTHLINIDFLQRVATTELIDFVMDLVVDPGLVVVHRIILDDFVSGLRLQLVDDLDLVESNDRPTGGPTGNVGDLVGLNRDLDRVMHIHQWQFPVKAGTRDAIPQCSSPIIDSDVALGDLVQPHQAAVCVSQEDAVH